MDADFSVELGADDPTLDFPWEDAGTSLRHFDVKRHPELLRFVDEAERYPELHTFLAAVNSQSSIYETAKCDVWSEDELTEAEDIYDADQKLVSYVDVLFAAPSSARFDFPAHERLVRRLVDLLGRAPEISSAAEFIVRRCLFSEGNPPESGFYVTFYLSGYGNDPKEARLSWAIGLNVVQNALLQLSAEYRNVTSQGSIT